MPAYFIDVDVIYDGSLLFNNDVTKTIAKTPQSVSICLLLI